MSQTTWSTPYMFSTDLSFNHFFLLRLVTFVILESKFVVTTTRLVLPKHQSNEIPATTFEKNLSSRYLPQTLGAYCVVVARVMIRYVSGKNSLISSMPDIRQKSPSFLNMKQVSILSNFR